MGHSSVHRRQLQLAAGGEHREGVDECSQLAVHTVTQDAAMQAAAKSTEAEEKQKAEQGQTWKRSTEPQHKSGYHPYHK